MSDGTPYITQVLKVVNLWTEANKLPPFYSLHSLVAYLRQQHQSGGIHHCVETGPRICKSGKKKPVTWNFDLRSLCLSMNQQVPTIDEVSVTGNSICSQSNASMLDGPCGFTETEA